MKIMTVLWVILILILGSCHSSSECEEVISVENNKGQIDSLFLLVKPTLKKLGKKEIHQYEGEIYRVWYFHALAEGNYFIEYEKNDKEALIRFERFSFGEAKNSSKTLELYENKLEKEEWNHIKYLINRYDFWKSEIKIERLVPDGYEYIIEGKKSGCNKSICKIVYRKSPESGDKMDWLGSDLFIIGERLKESKN